MSNADLIERLLNHAEKRSKSTMTAAANALAAADKRIAELEQVNCSRLDEAESKLALARDELLRCKRIMLHECGIGIVNEVVLAQIGGDDAAR